MKSGTNGINQKRRSVVKGIAAGAAAAALPMPAIALSERPTAVVIGAGIAGLSAAYDLRKAGFDVTILEKEKFTGGRMREGWMGPLYQFTHAVGVFGANHEMFALAAEVGIEDQIRGEPFPEGSIDNGVGHYSSPLGDFYIDKLATIPGVSAETKKRLHVLQADLDEIRQTVDPCLLETGASYDNESLTEYYERMLGKEAASEIIRYWIEPQCSAWGWPPQLTSKIALLSWFAPNDSFLAPRGGIGVLTRKLGSMLPVQNNTTVHYITPADASGRHTIHYLTPDLERRTVTPDIVVCAVEGKYLDKLVQDMTPKQEALAKNCYFTKEAIVCWILDESHAPKEYTGGRYIPDHPDPIKGKTTYWFVTPARPDVNHPPHARYCLSRRDTPNWQVSGKPMEEYCWPMMKYFYPALEQSHVVDIVNYTCDDLIYMPVGYIRQIADVLSEQAKERRSLYFAGEYVSGAHTGAACASGRSIARLINKHWA